ncbi:MAG TPA: acyl-CoA dehydrogenase, partial [Sphingomonas sp.]|nr:acyl-CoA dehydrogenase [Sphingomonas sp.]
MEAAEIATRVEAFVRETIAPYEHDPRCTPHGPSEALVTELRDHARAAGLLTPHIANGAHL